MNVYEQQGAKSFKVIARCYGSMSLFLSITHNVFLLYYVDMFVNVYRIDKVSFWIGEVIFLVWNSVNDPLFGWLSDKSLLQKNQNHWHNVDDQVQIVVKRVNSLRKNGPLFAFSFLLFWIHWLPTFLQFVICLCLYDGFLTAVDLQHTSLLADLAVRASDRNTLNRYCSIASILGSASVFVSYAVWSHHSVQPFQIFCALTALFSAFGFYVTSRFLLKEIPKFARHSGELDEVIESKDKVVNGFQADINVIKYMRQLAKNKNFRWFIAMNLLQVFHCHFNSNFFPLFMDTLVGNSLPNSVCTLLIGMSFVVPHINNIYFLHLCEKCGVYNVVNSLFWVKLILAISMMVIGADHIWITCIFIASNRIFTEGTCKLLNLVISDLVDEDYVLHNRPHPASALLFGMSSLLSKPGQTLAPLLGTFLLSLYTGREVFQSDAGDSLALGVKQSGIHGGDLALYRSACFNILVAIPIFCGCLQLLAWNRFSLKGTKLQQIKNLRICRNLECVC